MQRGPEAAFCQRKGGGEATYCNTFLPHIRLAPSFLSAPLFFFLAKEWPLLLDRSCLIWVQLYDD